MTTRERVGALTLSMLTLRTLTLCLLTACAAPAGDRTGSLNAVAWTQTAAEHDALCRQVFAAASAAVPRRAASADSTPMAVIVDIDETVLDNSPYQARLVLDQQAFASPTWNAWCREAKAEAIPGAVAFTQACHAQGVRVFYITNRTKEVEAATRANLEAHGFPLAGGEGIDAVLSRGDVDGKSSKVGRRASVAAEFRVLVMVGDDLHDFVDAEPSLGARRAALEEHAGKWGTEWFLLPNAMYGSWERTLTAGEDDAVAAKRAALRPGR